MISDLDLKLLSKMTKDVRNGSKLLGQIEARFLVDYYYQMQSDRIVTQNRIRAISQSSIEEPHEAISFIGNQISTIEENLKKVLDSYTDGNIVGKWCKSIVGIGPVIAAGLISNLDVDNKPTAGHFWSYCGLNDNNRPWLGREKTKKIIDEILGDKKSKDITYEDFCKCCVKTQWKPENLIEATGKDGKKIFYSKDGKEYSFKKEDIIAQCSKRPYNAKLKTLLWKLGQSFVKVSNNPNDFYGKIYQQRKAYEQEKNERKEYKEQAEQKAKIVGKTTEAYKYYSQGMLPPAHIQARAERYAVRIFISHLHKVMYMVEYGVEPPKPFALAILNHAHEIEVPNLDMITEYLKNKGN